MTDPSLSAYCWGGMEADRDYGGRRDHRDPIRNAEDSDESDAEDSVDSNMEDEYQSDTDDDELDRPPGTKSCNICGKQEPDNEEDKYKLGELLKKLRKVAIRLEVTGQVASGESSKEVVEQDDLAEDSSDDSDEEEKE